MPNAIAYMALLGFPFVAVFFFRMWTVPTAVAATLLGGYLFLPSQPSFDFPLIPVLDKNTIPALVAMAMATFSVSLAKTYEAQAKRRGITMLELDEMLPGWLPRSRLTLICLALLMSTAIGSVITNTEPVRVTSTITLPGLRPYDIFSLALTWAFILPPFLLGRKFFFRDTHHRKLLTVFAILGLIYSFFALVEIRFSPQINTWIYGYFPHSFGQHVRNGGYRPLVFLQHGLWLAIFQAMAMTAALAMSRVAPKEQRRKWLMAALWIFAVMFLSRSLGGFALAGMMLLVLLLLPARMVGFVCVGLVSLSILYPLARMASIVPLDGIYDVANAVAPERSGSLKFRFDNEEALLDLIAQKPVFGWGGWGRNSIYDPLNGKKLSTVDSRWIISLGVYGIVGFLGEYGLHMAALLAIGFGITRREIPMATRGLMAMLTINMIDTLINGTVTSATWLVAGALTGYLEACRSPATAPGPDKATAEPSPRKGPERRSGRARPVQAMAKEAVTAEEDAGPIHSYTRQRVKHVRQN